MKTIFAVLAVTSIALAQSGKAPVRVLASNGMKAVIDDVRAQCEHTAGAPIDMQVGTSTALKAKIAGGEAFDLVIITAEVADELVKSKTVDGATRMNLGRSGIGVGVRKGAAKLNISSAEAMKKTLLAAKTVTYATAGASRPTLEKMFERMGIASAMAPKLKLQPSSTEAAAQVVAGNVEILLTLISEIVPVKGMNLVGPLPAEFQTYVAFAEAVGSKAKNAAAAKAFAQCLAGAASNASLAANGMERVR
jgi:molybdate transport system substrate-binding protein